MGFESKLSSYSSDSLSTTCRMTLYNGHAVPQPGVTYFSPSAGSSTKNNPNSSNNSKDEHLLICIPAYNEQGSDLQSTLESLYAQSQELPNVRFSVCCIIDGISMASESLKEYIATMLGDTCCFTEHLESHDSLSIDISSKNSSGSSSPRTILHQKFDHRHVSSHHPILQVIDGIYEPGKVATIILENIDAESQEVSAVPIAPGHYMEVSFVVKLDNRRKHNSHEWFLSGFGSAHIATAKYIFMTDTGTRYHPGCLSKLIALLRDNPDDYCAAVAFQRPTVTEAGWNVNKLFHGYSQIYEFYAANYGMAASFALVGFQPVIPGPCQMFSASAGLSTQFRQAYSDVGHVSASQFSFINSNMMLAEDRFFTNYLYCTSLKKIGYVCDSIFSYDLVITPQEFLNQRRRWTNGTLAANCRLLVDYPKWSRNMPRMSSLLVLFAMMMYTFQLMFSMLTPGIMTGGIFQAVGCITDLWFRGYDGEYYSKMTGMAVLVAAAVAGVYFALHMAFMVTHHKRNYNRLIYQTNQALNTVLVILLTFHAINQLRFETGDEFTWLFLTSTATLFSYPAMMSVLIGDWAGLIYGSICFIPYFIFRASYSLAMSYGVSQCWCLTWGTRPHDSHSKEGRATEMVMARIYRTAKTIWGGYVLTNFMLAVFFALLVYNYNFNTILLLQGAFILPVVGYYPFGAAFFVLFAAKKLRSTLFNLAQRYQASSRRNAKTFRRYRLIIMMLAVVQALFFYKLYGVAHHHLANITDTDINIDSTPPPASYLQHLQQCTDFECLKAAHQRIATYDLTSSDTQNISLAPVSKYNFPAAVVVGFDETNTDVLHQFLLLHQETLKTPASNHTKLDSEFFTLQCKANPVSGCSKQAQAAFIADVLHKDAYVNSSGQGFTYDISRNYAMNGNHLADGVAKQLPWVKLVVTLREPISRAMSHLHKMALYYNKGCLTHTNYDLYNCLVHESRLAPRHGHFDNLNAKDPSISDSMAQWMMAFPPGQLHVMQYEQFWKSPAIKKQELNALEEFLNLEADEEAVVQIQSEPDVVEREWSIEKDAYEQLVSVVRSEAEEIAYMLEDGGYITDAEAWLEPWESVWQGNLQRCDDSTGMCSLELS